MGDDAKAPLKLNFDPKVRLEFRGATIDLTPENWSKVYGR